MQLLMFQNLVLERVHLCFCVSIISKKHDVISDKWRVDNTLKQMNFLWKSAPAPEFQGRFGSSEWGGGLQGHHGVYFGVCQPCWYWFALVSGYVGDELSFQLWKFPHCPSLLCKVGSWKFPDLKISRYGSFQLCIRGGGCRSGNFQSWFCVCVGGRVNAEFPDLEIFTSLCLPTPT